MDMFQKAKSNLRNSFLAKIYFGLIERQCINLVFAYYLQHYLKSCFVLILGDNDAKRLLLEQNGTAHMMQVLSMATHENLIEIALKVFQVRKFSEITNFKNWQIST